MLRNHKTRISSIMAVGEEDHSAAYPELQLTGIDGIEPSYDAG